MLCIWLQSAIQFFIPSHRITQYVRITLLPNTVLTHYDTWWEWSFSDLSCNLNHIRMLCQWKKFVAPEQTYKIELKTKKSLHLWVSFPTTFVSVLVFRWAILSGNESMTFSSFSNLVCNESQIELIWLSSHKLSNEKQDLIDRYVYMSYDSTHTAILIYLINYALHSHSKYYDSILRIDSVSI